MNRRDAAELVQALESMGFYKYLSPGDARAAKGQLPTNPRRFYLDAGRAFEADAEDLAEGGVSELLEQMREVLTAEGCVVGKTEDSYSEDGYTVLLDGRPYPMWTKSEGKRSWELTVKRTANLINHLLSGRSSERLFLLHGGEDGLFVILDPAMQRLIAASGMFGKDSTPGEV